MGSATPGQVVVWGLRTMRLDASMHQSPVVLLSGSWFGIPQQWTGTCKTDKPFLPQHAFGRCFYHRDRKQMRTVFFLVVLYSLCSLALIIFIIIRSECSFSFVSVLFSAVAAFLKPLVLTSTRHFLQRWTGHGNLTLAAYFRKIFISLNSWRLVFSGYSFPSL